MHGTSVHKTERRDEEEKEKGKKKTPEKQGVSLHSVQFDNWFSSCMCVGVGRGEGEGEGESRGCNWAGL